jgi:hypothetical protein
LSATKPIMRPQRIMMGIVIRNPSYASGRAAALIFAQRPRES